MMTLTRDFKELVQKRIASDPDILDGEPVCRIARPVEDLDDDALKGVIYDLRGLGRRSALE
jgi:hypothetical protein